jgi:hypothetical protein
MSELSLFLQLSRRKNRKKSKIDPLGAGSRGSPFLLVGFAIKC